LRKEKSGKYIKRDASTGRFVVTKAKNNSVTVKGDCVIITSSGARVAKTSAKGLIRYNKNVGLMLRNDRRESEMAESVSSKSQSSIEKKYQNI
jgi:hypothetical protein